MINFYTNVSVTYLNLSNCFSASSKPAAAAMHRLGWRRLVRRRPKKPSGGLMTIQKANTVLLGGKKVQQNPKRGDHVQKGEKN